MRRKKVEAENETIQTEISAFRCCVIGLILTLTNYCLSKLEHGTRRGRATRPLRSAQPPYASYTIKNWCQVCGHDGQFLTYDRYTDSGQGAESRRPAPAAADLTDLTREKESPNFSTAYEGN
ncbi:hypothetical protein EVAR_83596_1 [Eumeta japonica]|uniref:Uncharacterized protein n=1 Tax=Eumeta variegata TaxID=151549 RepID=A0A4C1UPS6_EUMVA|nr:hypothetical protein EVAR_83596_1 [Eumeta japonica]